MTSDFDVFLCHNSEDKKEVKRIGLFLKEAGLKPWLDEWELRPGTSWQDALEEQIKRIPAAAVFVGATGMGPWHNRELQAFIREFVDRNCIVIPVILEGKTKPKLPLFLKGLAWVDFRKKEPEPLQHLIWGITGKKAEDIANSESQTLLNRLHEAEKSKMDALDAGEDTKQIDLKLVEIKKQLRETFHLHPDDYLDSGRYELVKILGTGGFGQVWKARDHQRKQFVAIKVLHHQFVNDKTMRDRFFRGAQKMAGLNHPGITEVFEPKKVEGGCHYFVMAYLEGGDLRNAILNKTIKKNEVIPIILQIGAALEYAHKLRIVHRDVKPGNVLIDKQGQPKLTDFDLVRAADTTGGTRTGAMGTFIFAAPEAMEKAKDVDYRADVYGLAMTAIYCMLQGNITYEIIRNPHLVLKKISCSRKMQEILLKGISWDVNHRYPSVNRFCGAIKDAPMQNGDFSHDYIILPNQRVQKEYRTLINKAQWIQILPGSFTMGDEDRGDSANRPTNTVAISQPYYLGRFPVTNEQYKIFKKHGGYTNYRWWTPEGWTWKCRTNTEWLEVDSRFSDQNQPVVGVSWYEADAFCRWLTDVFIELNLWGDKPLVALLPTEAQWEYAARGKDNRPYPWGSEQPNSEFANFHPHGPQKTTPQGTYPKGKTPEGLEDMAGNIWEWCKDTWDKNLYEGKKKQTNPLCEKGDGELRTVRGGSWHLGSGHLASVFRNGVFADSQQNWIGFRVCLTARYPQP